jgi:hypothetical protein
MLDLPSRISRKAVIERMKNPDMGFNARLAEICADYSLPPFTINFEDDSPTFFEALLTAEQLSQITTVKYPCLVVYSGSLQDEQRVKPSIMAGGSGVFIDAYLEITSYRRLTDLEELSDAVEGAIWHAMNDGNYQAWDDQLGWSGLILCDRSPFLIDEARAIMRALHFTLPFEVQI